jgi:hypothetical protein
MGLIAPFTSTNTNAPIWINAGDSASRVAAAPSGSLILCSQAGEYTVATFGVAWIGYRTFTNAGINTIQLRTSAATSFLVTLDVGETVEVTYNGTSSSLQASSIFAVNHKDIKWSGTATIPVAATNANGLLSSTDKTKLNGLNTPASGNASTTELVLGSDTRLTNSRTPTSHTHGNISNLGRIGSTAGLPIITGTDGALEAGSFGSSGSSTVIARNDHQHPEVIVRTMATWSRTGGVTTATFVGDHNLSVGQQIDIIGSQPPANSTDGTWTIASVPSSTSVTFADTVGTPATGTGGVAYRRGFLNGADKALIESQKRNVFGPSCIMHAGNRSFGASGYAAGNPPAGMFPFSPTGNSVENFDPTEYHPRTFNAGQFFGVNRLFRIMCIVRCTGITFDGVHCQLRYWNGTQTQIVSGLSDFGGSNDGIASKSYFATSDPILAADQWWTFIPYFGAFNGSNSAIVQDVSVIAYLV